MELDISYSPSHEPSLCCLCVWEFNPFRVFKHHEPDLGGPVRIWNFDLYGIVAEGWAWLAHTLEVFYRFRRRQVPGLMVLVSKWQMACLGTVLLLYAFIYWSWKRGSLSIAKPYILSMVILTRLE